MLATRRAGFSPGLFGKQSPEALSGIASQPEPGAGRIELNGAAKGGNVRVLNPGPLHDATVSIEQSGLPANARASLPAFPG